MNIYSTTTDNYTFSTGGFDIILNALGTDSVGRNYTQCYVIPGAKLYVYINDDKFDVHILRRVMTGEEVEGMPDTLLSNVYARDYDIQCFPSHFTSDAQVYVYAAIPRSETADQIATIVYPSQKIDLFGCVAADGSDPENPTLIQVGNPDYYYINLFGIISSASIGAREWINNIIQGAINGYIVGDDAAITRGNSQLTKEDLEREIRELRDYIDSNLFFERYPLGDPYQETTTDPESGEQVPLYEQSKDKEGELLYWTTSEQVDKSTTETEWPVMEPVMNENTAIRLKPKFLGLFADGFVSALGVNPDSSMGGGSGVDLLTNWSAFAGLDDDALSHFAVGANLIYELKQKVDSLPSGGSGSGSSADISAYTFWGQRPDGTTVSGSLSNVGNITFAPVPDASASPYSIGTPTLGIHRLYFGTTGIYLELTSAGHLHTNAALYSDSFISALGLNDDSSAVIGGADLLSDWSRIKQHIDSGDASSFAVSANLIYELYTRKQGLDESDVTSIINKYKFATQADLANYVTLHTPQTIDGAKTFDEDITLTPSHSIIIGDAVIGYDSTHHALSITHKTKGESMGLYATGFVSALGVNDESSSGAIDQQWLIDNGYLTRDEIITLIGTQTPDRVLTQDNWQLTINSTALQNILNGVYALKSHDHDSISGNAATATKLKTSRKLWGQSFNGTADVKGSLSNAGSITFASGVPTPSDAASPYSIGSETLGIHRLYFGTSGIYLEVTSEGHLHTNAGLYSDSFVSALGLNDQATAGIDQQWLVENGYLTREQIIALIPTDLPSDVLTQTNWKTTITKTELTTIISDYYALKGHNHDSAYAPQTHNHDDAYAPKEHTHSQYALTTDVDNALKRYVTLAGNDEWITGTKIFSQNLRLEKEPTAKDYPNLQISGGMICSELGTPLNHGIKLGYNGINETHFYEYDGRFVWHKHPGNDPDITLMSLTPDYLTLRAATKLRLGSVILEDDTKGNLKVTGGIWSTSFVSALGINDASASSGIDKAWLDDNGYITRTEVQQLIAAAGIGSGSEIDTSEFITSEQVSSTTTDYLADYMKASNLGITTWSGDATSMTAKLRYNSQDYEIGTIPAATTSKAGLMSAIHLTDLNNIKNDYVTRTTYQTISAEKLFSSGIRLGVNAKILDSDGSENHAISIGGSGKDYMDFYLCMGGNASYRWHDRYVSGNRDDILMTLTTTGLGIGLGNTTYPSFRLHVNGTARIVDDLQLGTSLTFKNGNKTISIEPDYTHNAIKINGNLYATGWISALGANGTNNDPLETSALKVGSTGMEITTIYRDATSGNLIIQYKTNGQTWQCRVPIAKHDQI